MAETILERHYRDRIESLRQMTLREADASARSWREFEDLINLCCELSASWSALLEVEYKRIFEEPAPRVGWLRERRLAIEDLSEHYLRAVHTVKLAAAHALQDECSPVARALTQLDDAVLAVVEAKLQMLQRWPVGDDAETAAAHAAAECGEGLDMEEAFAQIAGVSVAAWRKRIDESKQQLPS